MVSLLNHRKDNITRHRKKIVLNMNMALDVIRYHVFDKAKLKKIRMYEKLKKKYLPEKQYILPDVVFTCYQISRCRYR